MLKDSKRIVILGSGGCGKSTLAKKIQAHTGLPLIHLDREYQNDEWTPTPHEDWEEYQREITKEKQWIIDGNYGYTLDLRISACDTVIFLDYSRFICTFRAFKHMVIKPNEIRDDLGLKDKFDLAFLRWVFFFPNRGRKLIIKSLRRHPGKRVFHFRSPRELNRFLKHLDKPRPQIVLPMRPFKRRIS